MDGPRHPDPNAARRGWSVRFATIAGIDLRVHISFLLIVVLFAVGSSAPGGLGIASGMLWLGIVFACVTVHELAHSLMARRRGIGVQSITLLPIGGVSRLERSPDRPPDEFAISIVGPLASLVLAASFAGVALAAGDRMFPVDIYSGALLPRIAWFNLVIAGFNLLPAFPMDGGRVLRALLERRMDRVAATTTAARIGRAFAAAMIVGGLIWNVWLAVIGFFIYTGASSEEASAVVHARLRGIFVRDVMLLEPRVIDATTNVGDLRGISRVTAQQAFPVVRGGMYAGIIDADALEVGAGGVAVGDLADTGAPAVRPDEQLDRVVDVLIGSGRSAVAVVERGAVVGLLRLEDIERASARRALAA